MFLGCLNPSKGSEKSGFLGSVHSMIAFRPCSSEGHFIQVVHSNLMIYVYMSCCYVNDMLMICVVLL